MVDADILTIADARRDQALDIMHRLDLLRRWSEVGSVELVGSVALDVVVKPDIDLAIYVDVLDPARAFAALTPLSEVPGMVQTINYVDGRQWPIHGLYWQISTIDDGEEWTIDCWVLNSDRDQDSQHDVARSTRRAAEDIRRRPDARATILGIKHEAIERGRPVHGRWLYEAVLDDGIRTLDEYAGWMGNQDPNERSTWMPRGTR
ncbi:hypothetical protein [Microlunatus soli]|uniref:Nucleotidyltransferase domain-containing protein n=1 Tax=Microlunatus soli TaxID=630515 RepID=A0A1H1UPW8_9ACTN|nr:hypothetical protein [Microlunatus soli]SDS74598.1 hypothetical protein SAMN04489812_2886 [Microlunatus soli]